MTDTKAIDISPEAVGDFAAEMRRNLFGYGPSIEKCRYAADLLSALSAALSEARGKVVEADQNAEAMESKWRALAPHGTCACSMDSPEDVCLHHSPKLADAIAQRDGFRADLNATRLSLYEAIAERDAALAELTKLRAEAENKPDALVRAILRLPTDEARKEALDRLTGEMCEVCGSLNPRCQCWNDE